MSQAICIIYLSEARTEVQRPELASPGAAAIVARRESRSAMPDRMPERLKVAARDDSSDDEWDPEEVRRTRTVRVENEGMNMSCD